MKVARFPFIDNIHGITLKLFPKCSAQYIFDSMLLIAYVKVELNINILHASIPLKRKSEKKRKHKCKCKL